MPDDTPGGWVARVDGLVRGHPVSGDATLAVLDDGVRLEGGDVAIGFPFELIDGVVWREPRLELHLAGGDVLDLVGGPELGDAAAAIVGRACALPELTLPLRAFGSRRAQPGSEHDRFFGAIMRARRALEGPTTVDARLAAFDGRVLRAELEGAFAAIAAERFPDHAPERRAFEAELLECAERLFDRLAALDAAAARLRDADAAVAIAMWRAWSRELRLAFGEADRCWIATIPTLAHHPPQPPAPTPVWRRVRRPDR